MHTSPSTYTHLKARKPQGGFVFLTVQQLCLLWWVYRLRHIRLMDYRVWHACQEMVARRCQLAPGQVPAYTLDELHRLVGGRGGAHLRTSLKRLEACGLLTWTPTTLSFAHTPQDLRGTLDLTDFQRMLTTIPNPRRRVPVPRQTLRLLAGGCRPAVIATVLGVLCRCLYYHSTMQQCVSGGWWKCSWVAEVFRVHLRTVKAARRHLNTIGWLSTFPTSQRVQNRWGLYTQVSLSWKRSASIEMAADSTPPPAPLSLRILPPLPALSTPQLPPPLLDSEPLQEDKHQEPLPPEGFPTAPPCLNPLVNDVSSGVSIQDTTPTTFPHLPPPNLRHIVPEDLHSLERLLTLFKQANAHHFIGTSEYDRLTFVALAEHALANGTQNPCGLFAALLHRQQWDFITDGDEIAAQRRLTHYLYGAPTRTTLPPEPEPPSLSPDAAVVRAVRAHVARAGWPGDGFGLVHYADPTWTRARWEQAVAELEHVQQTWRRAHTLPPLGELQLMEARAPFWDSADTTEDAA